MAANASRDGLYGLLLIALASLPASASAYSSYGLGTLSCADYLGKRAEDATTGTMDNTVFVHAYLSGFLTGGNMLKGLAGDDAADINVNVHGVVQWLDTWCIDHRETRVASALETFWVEAAAAKLKLKSMSKAELERLRRSTETP